MPSRGVRMWTEGTSLAASGREPVSGGKPGDGSQEQDRLHHGEAVADANPRAVAKGEVREARQVLRRLFAPARRVKRSGSSRSAVGWTTHCDISTCVPFRIG